MKFGRFCFLVGCVVACHFARGQEAEDPLRVVDDLKTKTLHDFFETSCKGKAINPMAEQLSSAELNKFSDAYERFVTASAEVGFFGRTSITRSQLKYNPERDEFTAWFNGNLGNFVNCLTVKQYGSETLMGLLRESYDVFIRQRYAKDRDDNRYLQSALAFLHVPDVVNTVQFAHHDHPVLTWVVVGLWGFGTTAVLLGPGKDLATSFFKRPVTPLIEFTEAKAARIWAKPAVIIQNFLNAPKKKREAAKLLIDGQKAASEMDQFATELHFEGMTKEQAETNWKRMVQYCIELNQVFSETVAQVNGGRGLIFNFSMDAHRNYATSLAIFHRSVEDHRRDMDLMIDKIARRMADDSRLHEHQMRLAMHKPTDPEYAALDLAYQNEKIKVRDDEFQLRSAVKTISEKRYDVENLSRRKGYEAALAASDAEIAELAAPFPIHIDELKKMKEYATEIRVAQRQSAAALFEWVYFQFTHKEIGTMAERSEIGRDFLKDYKTIQDWFGYSHYLKANRFDLQDLFGKMRFDFNVNVLLKTRETLVALGADPATVPAVEVEAPLAEPHIAPDECGKRFGRLRALAAKVRKRFYGGQ